jgi:hypothetical protein
LLTTERAITGLWNSKQYVGIVAVMHAAVATQLCLGSKRTLNEALMQILGLEVVKLTGSRKRVTGHYGGASSLANERSLPTA